MIDGSDADDRDVDRAAEGDALHHVVDVVGRLLARADAGDVRLLVEMPSWLRNQKPLLSKPGGGSMSLTPCSSMRAFSRGRSSA